LLLLYKFILENGYLPVLPIISLSKSAKGDEGLSKNKVVKSVAFNITNEQDVKFLEHVGEANFSRYVKDLILADMEKRNQGLRIVQKSEKGGIKYILPAGKTTPPPSECITL
jgi:hypothetical protein